MKNSGRSNSKHGRFAFGYFGESLFYCVCDWKNPATPPYARKKMQMALQEEIAEQTETAAGVIPR